MAVVNVVVFGCGRMGRVHLTTLAALTRVRVKWVVDDAGIHPRVQQVLESLRLHTTNVADIADVDTVLGDKEVTAVVICTPASNHESLIQAALKAGKHVFCEKPIGLSSESVKSSYRLAAEKDLTLYCGFQRRKDADFSEVYSKIRQGVIGTLRIIKVTSRDGPSHNTADFLKHSGGIFLDSCVHDLDIVCWLAGERPLSLVAYGHAHEEMFAECQDVDMTSIMVKFPSGAIATIDNSRMGAEYGYDQRLEVLGSSGMLKIENPRTSSVQQWCDVGTVLAPMIHDGVQRYLSAYRTEIGHFIDIVTGERERDMSAESVITVSQMVELCQESLDTGRSLPLPQLHI
ncbi:inositol 2-dehydrogenase-like [Haliotis asinina]|uniref:inositol 2-dehydrogenase-like n=1 Tax=Haliotis asinina TaxID=109174 RepID=UPI003531B734